MISTDTGCSAGAPKCYTYHHPNGDSAPAQQHRAAAMGHEQHCQHSKPALTRVPAAGGTQTSA